jgi:hypothetical protein
MRLFGHRITSGRETLAVMAGVAFTVASAAFVLAMVVRPGEAPIETSMPVASSVTSSTATP